MAKKVRFTLLLPFQFNDKSEIPEDYHFRVGSTIAKRFGGISMFGTRQNPIRGKYKSKINDEMMDDNCQQFTVDIDSGNAEKAETFFTKYKKCLLVKFQQEDIYLGKTDIDLL